MLNRSGSQFQKYDLFNMIKSVSSQYVQKFDLFRDPANCIIYIYSSRETPTVPAKVCSTRIGV